MTEQRRVRPTRRSVAQQPIPPDQPNPLASPTVSANNPWVATLSPGDQIEFSITAEVKNRSGRSFWCKGGTTTTIRPDESVQQAKDRAVAFVSALVDEQVTEYLT